MADKRLIPDGIRDANTEAFNKLIDRFSNLDLTKLLIYIINNVDASVLPHLAWQFHIEGWELAETVAEKRALIKKAIELHRYKGTKWALLNVLKELSLKGDIKEWFEYGGEPYHFKVEITSIAKQLTIKKVQSLYRLIDEYKNVRSWLEDLILVYLTGRKLWFQNSAVAEGFAEARLLRETELEAQGLGWYQTAAIAEDYVVVYTERAVENMSKSLFYQTSANMAECFSWTQMR